MASRYGIDTDNWRYADNSPVTSGRGRQANMLNAGLAAYQAVRGFQGDQADSEAAAAAKAAQQEQTQLGPETSSQKGSQYYDQDQSGGLADGNYVMNAAGRQGYNEDGSDMTAAQTAMEDRGVAPTYKQQYGLGASPTTFRDTQYTPAEKRTAGLQARVNYWTGSDTVGAEGKAEKAQDRLDLADDRAEARIDRGLTRDSLRRQGILTDQQVAAGERTAAARRRVDAVQDRFSKNPDEFGTMAFNNDLSVDGEKHAGKKVQSMALPDGSGYLVWGVDADGKPITKSDGTSHSRVMTQQEMRDQGQLALLGQLAIADPENYLGKAIEAGLSKKKLDITAQHYREEAEKSLRADGIMGKRLDAEMKKIDVQLANYHQLAKARQPQQDLYAYQLDQQKKFDTAREAILDDTNLTDAQKSTKIAQLAVRYGGPTGGLGRPAPEVKPADVLAAMEKFPRATFNGATESDAAYTDRIRGLLSGGSPGAGGSMNWGAPGAAQSSTAATTPGAPAVGPPTRSLQTKYGPLTPMSIIENDAALGVPEAADYLRRRNAAGIENEVERERLRITGGL